jgi:prepilin-type N-terminal cleavage/methylation domain-containing protein
MNTTQKGFTLIELLVVIAIVAVLSVVVILTLNPAELLKQARDSNRISDMSTMKNAIAQYLADGQTVLAPDYTLCWMTVTATANCGGTFSAAYTATTTASTDVGGTGWVPVNFNVMTTRSPLNKLPLDPINNASYFYAYGASSSNNGFKTIANMESTKYAQSGGGDIESTDGGSVPGVYEAGSNLSL